MIEPHILMGAWRLRRDRKAALRIIVRLRDDRVNRVWTALDQDVEKRMWEIATAKGFRNVS